MQKKSIVLLSTFVLFIFLTFTTQAQDTAPKTDIKNYEATIRVLLGSNSGSEKGSLPKELLDITAQIKPSYNFSSYSVTGVYKARIGTTGGASYRSLEDIFERTSGQAVSPLPSFLEWRLSGLTSQSKSLISFQGFKFGARIPVKMGIAGAEQYESVGLDIDRFSVPAGEPTLIGTLSSTKTDGTAFVILTVRLVD